MSLRPQSCLGRYELIREVARSNDVVFEAWDPHTERRVALKALNMPDGVTDSQRQDRTLRFEREARASARLHHPNIVTLFDFGTDDGQPFLVFEFIEGPTLSEVIEKNGFLDSKTAIRYTIQLLSAIGYAHARRVIHRDIKPSNIFICVGDHLKIADLGIARIESEQSVTSDGQIFGTPAYMAPEQVKGQAIDQRVDIWAAGVVLYQMLTGVQPFTGGTVLEIGSNIITKEPDFKLVRDARLRKLLAKALAKDAADRFLTAAEMIERLEDPASVPATIVVSHPTMQMPAGIAVAVRTRSQASTWVATVLGALVIGVGAATLRNLHDGSPPPAQPQVSSPHQGPVVEVAAKSLDDVLAEAWEHNSLHELANSDHFKILPLGAQLDQLDTWCRTTMGGDYLALNASWRNMLLNELINRFGGGAPHMRNFGTGTLATLPTQPAKPLKPATSAATFPGPYVSPPVMSNQTGSPHPSESAGPGSSTTVVINDPPPQIPPGTIMEPNLTNPRRPDATDPAVQVPPTNMAQNTAPPPPAAEGQRVWPQQRAVDFDDTSVLRRLHFRARNVKVLRGGVRQYSGPDGTVTIK